MKSLALASLLSLSASAFAGEPLDIHAGTMELGGSGTVELLASNGDTFVAVLLAPSFGYFITDNVELRAGVGIAAASGVSSVGVDLGAQYLFPGDSLRPYAGGHFGLGDNSDPVVGAQGGLLVPLSSAIALDLGARLDLILGQGMTAVHLPVGALGVRGFF